MFVDRRGSREGKKTSLRQTDKAKKHATTSQAGAGGPVLRTCTPTRLLASTHATPIFDAGANLVNRQFENDFQRVVTRALKEGVTGMVVVPNDFDKVAPAITLCKWLPGAIYTVAGIHPSNINNKKVSDKQYATMLQQLREKLILPEVVAVLCGLDFSRDVGLRIPQEKFLREELKLAGELGLPVVFVLSHASQLSDEEETEVSVLLSLIGECRGDFKEGLVHNFYGSEPQLKAFLDLGMHVSISGIITSERQSVTTLIPSIPRDKFFLCSDAPYHTPQNIPDSFVRDSRNEPSNLPHVLLVCAKAYGITPKQLSETVQENSIRFFNLNSTPTNTEEAKPPTEAPSKKPAAKDKKGDKKQTTKKEKDEEEEVDSDEDIPKGKIGKGKKAPKGKKKEESDDEEEIPKPKKGQKKGKAVSSDEEVVSKSTKKNSKKGAKDESSEEEIVKPNKKGQKQKGKRKDESSDEEVAGMVKSKKAQQKKKGKGKESSEEEEGDEEEEVKPKSKKSGKEQPKSKPQEKPTKQTTKQVTKPESTDESEEEEEEEEEAEEEVKETKKEQTPVPDIKNLTIESDEERIVEYACKMCRTKLFTSENLQAHQTAQGLKNDICKMYFLDPMDWMKKTLVGAAEGRLECPKCEQKLGRFDASGISCTCGTTVRPAYKVVKSRVDVIGDGHNDHNDNDNEEEDEQEVLFGDDKKKMKKKRVGARKVTKGNFSHFRNKDYSAKKKESESDE